ncbi:hypothetical protein A3B50_04180 [Candidatus Roizmanbacteria bacterium RIFCSPLOWO2_01_FULL_40_42]|uniref:Uncharacterized protein n=1 Tax=Candidatus Roizmanbacteria bacterium RIFCSPLOWO2_01_FULL_40_42 TaxID=1802066 RepID=A0A1F7J1Z0_9BACT|nr:MAG: hypothetical protein A2W49_04715 [Candidatus Roizmanbacteria bacterium RIFCSPHIGHO2_12_41_18]OGK49622.1 MAG: hypothetical protein A3B50_04180 [Candidatus Roizmanbacteria bacterium RIFCSPLOWO2_01_FULL_40_42]
MLTPQIDQLPQWVVIAQQLGVPTILGAAIGLGSSYLLFKLATKREGIKWKQDIAEKILKEVYSYNVVVINLFHPGQPFNKEGFIEAARKFNEVEAVADLFVSSDVQSNLEKIKSLILEMKDEIDEKFKQGHLKGNRRELLSGKKYYEELDKLKENLRKWLRDS